MIGVYCPLATAPLATCASGPIAASMDVKGPSAGISMLWRRPPPPMPNPGCFPIPSSGVPVYRVEPATLDCSAGGSNMCIFEPAANLGTM